ncbi:hypothetical protein GGTG_03522 [Gaeumannomyces tritici R3-111a-1]|uniref:Conidiation-specific protein 13 n=1 Tax=Gaeumannomyces tritici (strain R3-111a-1) TaxID=644352 RepID=J3NQG5_GAET3|nr:hypothetical protein GGTG_03522 [Gaeumannomyces tritici R3-111a-1]EJT78421.1 hypothetical protein GGTG_03522 [Gaeumannomyces tritici R3-111a-1]
MRGLLLIAIALVALFHGYAVATVRLSKPVISPEFEMSKYDNQLEKELPARPFSLEYWSPDLIPKIYFNLWVNNVSYSPFDIGTVNVLYPDCPHYQVVSRHKNYEESWDSIFKRLSKVPVGMRQWTGNILFLPARSTTAFQLGSSVTFTKALHNLGVAAHEFTHVLDAFALADYVQANGYKPGTRYSETSMWADAYNRDSATATPYGRTNWVENFADAGRFAMSDMTTQGGIISRHSNWSGIATQNANYRRRLEHIIFPEGFPRGGLCTGKVPGSPAVWKSTGEERDVNEGMDERKRKRNKHRVRRVPVGAENIPIIVLPDFKSEPVVYRGP